MPGLRDIFRTQDVARAAREARWQAAEAEKQRRLNRSRAALSETGADAGLSEISERNNGTVKVNEDQETGRVRKTVSWRHDYRGSHQVTYTESSVSVSADPDGTISVEGKDRKTIGNNSDRERRKKEVDEAMGDAYTHPSTREDGYTTVEPAKGPRRRPEGGW